MNNETLFYGEPKKVFEGFYNVNGWGGDDPDCTSPYCNMLIDHIYHALDHVTLDGLYMEFGVYQGRTLRRIANKINPKTVYGFDVFTTGLPEAWHCVPKGGFSIPVPEFEEENIKLVVGLYEDTCKSFDSEDTIAFLHIDCDLYSSTKTVFDRFKNQIVSGTVIVFDEYYNYPGYEQHEYKAFKEFLEENSFVATPIGVMKTNAAAPASFVVTKKDAL